MHLHRILPLLCGVLTIVGCASTPPALDSPHGTQQPAQEYSDVALARQNAATIQNGFERSKYQLLSGSESDRIRACEELGRVAFENETDSDTITLLANVMKTDQSMKVRLAATDAIGLLKGGEMHERVASMLPSKDLPDVAPSRLSLIKQLWR